jgi:large subunit ribosomal protein L3
MKFILAKKLGMSQVFEENGKAVSVTLLEAKPNAISALRTKEKHGYQAVQVNFGTFKREFRKDPSGFKVGDKITVEAFTKGDKIDVIGTSKGRGFQGVVKRHGFRGAPKSHGTKHAHREPGSIGATNPQRVIKGKRMAGRMGNVRVTIKNLKVVDVKPDKNLILVSGAVPGARGAVVMVKTRN